jgi:outer membrane receptor protein involved in Fe transport
MKTATRFRKRPIAAAISALAMPATLVFIAPCASGAPGDPTVETITVTATRREETVQDVPINVSAVSGYDIEQQGIRSLAQLSQWVPGLYIVNQGSRGTGRIVARGLNADPLSAAEALGNDGGRMVATYLGEIPIYIDLKLNDMERVEVLLGPQGTLYGAGTMSGAIRYIPIKPLDRTEINVRGNGFGYADSDGTGGDGGITVNLPISDTWAFRGTYDYLDDPGFIDYDYVVREVGVSNPSAVTNPVDRAANTKEHADANGEETQSGRAALRWTPNDGIDATLTYYFQFMDSKGRNSNSSDSIGTDDYVSAARVLEPNNRDNQLISLEVTADLGFAQLTSATGGSRYEENGQRDQTDFLIGLEYSYELFPNFTAYTHEHEKNDTFTQELRLVSNSTGKWNWIVGGFYQDAQNEATSKEFTPLYDAFAVANLGGVALRPDSLEYIQDDKEDLTESAIFGEVGYYITEAWQITVGARWYKYELDIKSAVDFPFFNTVFDGAPPDQIILNYDSSGQDDNGDLYKFNTSYQFAADLLGYVTISEGYRIGGSNGVGACPDPLPATQIGCGLPNELQYAPDQTTNYEIGAHSTWLEGRLTLNGDVFYMDWDKPQIGGATENGLLPIKKNGSGAESYGGELSFNWLVSERLAVRGSYSYVKAELTDDAPNLVTTINPPGFQSTVGYVDGESGDRLPGSPEHQGNVFVSYTIPVFNGYELELNYGATAISDVLTRVGEKGFGESLDGYVMQDIGATLSRDEWTLTLYAMNVFNEYAETSASVTSAYVQTVADINGDPVPVRSYKHDVLPPRMVGLRFTWQMER